MICLADGGNSKRSNDARPIMAVVLTMRRGWKILDSDYSTL